MKRLLICMLFAALPAQAGYIWPKAEDSPVLRACGGPMLDTGETMTAAEQAAAKREVAACVRDYYAKQPKLDLRMKPSLPVADREEQRHQELLDAIRSLRD